MRSASRSPSVRSSRSGPVKDIDSTAPTVMTPMMTITTRISRRVNPPLRAPLASRFSTAWRRVALRAVGGLSVAGFGVQVPVADIRILAFPAFLAVGAKRVEVEFAAMGAGIDILIVEAPGILERAVLDVAALAPVADGRIRGLLDQGLQSLVRSRIFEVVEAVHGERRADGLDILAGLGDACFAHFADDTGHNDRREQPDDDHDDYDLDQREAAAAADWARVGEELAHGFTRVVRGAANG